MVKVKTTGFGFWKKTVVEHAGRTSSFSGSVKVEEKQGATCVTEKGLFSSNSACFLHDDVPGNTGASALPDGRLVGKSKSIGLITEDGSTLRYNSKPLSINRLEKHGDEVRVISSGIFGEKVVDRMPADKIKAIDSEDCNTCSSLNPLYQKS